MDSTSIWRPVRADLRRILLSVPGLPDMKWEGKRFKPTEGVPWGSERIEVATAVTETLGYAGMVQETGTYQIELFWPANGTVSDCEDVADRIRQTFHHGRAIGPEGIKGGVLSSFRMRSVETDQFYQVPVRVQFYIRRYTRQGTAGFGTTMARRRVAV